MKRLISYGFLILLGVVMAYIGSYGLDQGFQNESHYTGIIQGIYSFFTMMAGFLLSVFASAKLLYKDL